MIADANHSIGQYIRRYLRDNAAGLTYSQIRLLEAIRNSSDISQTGMVNATDIDRSTTAQIVLSLRNGGLLTRRRTKEDARKYAIRLTDKGEKALAHALPVLRAAEDTLASSAPVLQKAAAEFLKIHRRLVQSNSGERTSNRAAAR